MLAVRALDDGEGDRVKVQRDPKVGPGDCPRCGRPIVWALTDRDRRVALDLFPVRAGDPAGQWVVGLEELDGEPLTIRCRLAPPCGTSPRWSLHFARRGLSCVLGADADTDGGRAA